MMTTKATHLKEINAYAECFLKKKHLSPDVAGVILKFLDFKDLASCQQVHFKHWACFSIKVLSLHVPQSFLQALAFNPNPSLLQGMTALQELTLIEASDISLQPFSNLTTLKKLDVSYSPIRVSNLMKLINLQYLNLTGIPLQSGQVLINLPRILLALTDLQGINLKNCTISNLGLASLSNPRHIITLKGLDLSGSNITNEGVSHLTSLPALERLNLSGCQITDDSLHALSRLTNLQHLNLNYTYITDVAPLNHLTGLKSLRLMGCNKITNDSLAVLRDLASLESLSLSECSQITATGVLNLSKLTALKSLSLSGSDAAANLKALKESIPNLSYTNYWAEEIVYY